MAQTRVSIEILNRPEEDTPRLLNAFISIGASRVKNRSAYNIM